MLTVTPMPDFALGVGEVVQAVNPKNKIKNRTGKDLFCLNLAPFFGTPGRDRLTAASDQ